MLYRGLQERPPVKRNGLTSALWCIVSEVSYAFIPP